jgi:hypothetical protein
VNKTVTIDHSHAARADAITDAGAAVDGAPLPAAQPLRPRLEDGYLALIRRHGAGPQ